MNAWAKHREQSEFDAETESRIEFWKSLPEGERLRLAQLFSDAFGITLHPAGNEIDAEKELSGIRVKPPASVLGIGHHG